MATRPASNAEEIQKIQEEMAQIRRELHEDVQGAVSGARSLTDVLSYVRSYPWLSMGLVAAAGYLIVPRSHAAPQPQVVAAPIAATIERALTAVHDVNEKAKAKSRPGLFRQAIGMLMPIAVRAAQGYVSRLIEDQLTPPTPDFTSGGSGPAPRATSAPRSTAGARPKPPAGY